MVHLRENQLHQKRIPVAFAVAPVTTLPTQTTELPRSDLSQRVIGSIRHTIPNRNHACFVKALGSQVHEDIFRKVVADFTYLQWQNDLTVDDYRRK